jgi:hypothetical protein
MVEFDKPADGMPAVPKESDVHSRAERLVVSAE